MKHVDEEKHATSPLKDYVGFMNFVNRMHVPYIFYDTSIKYARVVSWMKHVDEEKHATSPL